MVSDLSLTRRIFRKMHLFQNVVYLSHDGPSLFARLACQSDACPRGRLVQTLGRRSRPSKHMNLYTHILPVSSTNVGVLVRALAVLQTIDRHRLLLAGGQPLLREPKKDRPTALPSFRRLSKKHTLPIIATTHPRPVFMPPLAALTASLLRRTKGHEGD